MDNELILKSLIEILGKEYSAVGVTGDIRFVRRDLDFGGWGMRVEGSDVFYCPYRNNKISLADPTSLYKISEVIVYCLRDEWSFEFCRKCPSVKHG